MMKLHLRKALDRNLPTLDDYVISSTKAAELSPKFQHDLGRAFFKNEGPVVHKWLQYLDVYDNHFARYRNTTVKILEIGVSMGGSLNLWREYFGPDATIYGIDIDPNCADRVTPPNQVRIGSQDDPTFLTSVIREIGEPDIILDDGSHIARHQKASFDILFPLLRVGGLYVIEDLHTAYWPGWFEGGYRRKGTAIELVKDVIDDMHGWYHSQQPTTPARNWIRGVHVYDSIVIMEKCKLDRPGHIKIGKDEQPT